MRKYLVLILFSMMSVRLAAQVVETPPAVEQQLEQVTESNEDAETEDDSYLQELVQFLNIP